MFFQGAHKELSESIEAIGASFAIYEFNPNDNNFYLISCNTLYEEILIKPMGEALCKNVDVIFPRYIAQPLSESFHVCKREQIASEIELLHEYKITERWWRSVSSPVFDTQSNKVRIIQTCVEISDKKKLEHDLNISLRRFEAVVQSAYDGIITIDETQNIKFMNNAARHIFGLTDEDLVGTPLTKLIPHKYRKPHSGYVDAFKKSQIDSRPMQSRASVRGLRKDGTEFPIEVTISKIHVGENIEMTAVVRDISEKNQLLEELLISSKQDPLTHLSNRRHFGELLAGEMARSKRYNHGFSLMMIDIDHYKEVNDTYGHECGDRVLTHLALVLKSCVRDTDAICRWGGEEFLIMLPETDIESAEHMANHIRTTIEKSEVIEDGEKLQVTASLGIVQCNPEELDADSLIRKADQAMYKAKEAGRNCIAQL